MKKLHILRVTAVTVLGLGLGAGVASAAPGDSSIEWTGPDSRNSIRFNRDVDVDVDNDTEVDVDNDNYQRAESGDAEVNHNTRGGSAESGDAANDNWTRINASVDNSGATAAAFHSVGGSWGGGASIDTTGPDSNNSIRFNSDVNVDVNNDTDIDVNNDNHQTAESGDATVYGNTRGGDATTGDASNINTTEVTLKVTN